MMYERSQRVEGQSRVMPNGQVKGEIKKVGNFPYVTTKGHITAIRSYTEASIIS